MSDDVVAQLKDLQDGFREHSIEMEVLQRAIDEIVVLRGYQAECERQFQAKVAEIGILLDRVHQARAEALEEAARVCERADRSTHPATCADMIRALKEKRDE